MKLLTRVSSGAVLCAVVLAAACGRAPAPREYELTGRILGVKLEEREVLIKHEDIDGFMPGMTMPFPVRDAALLDGKEPGDLVTATLVVDGSSAYLSTLTTTGHAPMDVPPPADTLSGFELLRTGDQVPDQVFVDQDGRSRSLTAMRGHRVAITFMYTRCPIPTFCPLMDRNFATLQRELQSSPDLADVRLLSVSFDPEFDTPQVLKAHAGKLGADPDIWTFLTGDRDEVTRLAARFGLGVERDQENPIDILHTLRTAVIDADGRLAGIRTGNSWTPTDILADLRTIPAPAN